MAQIKVSICSHVSEFGLVEMTRQRVRPNLLHTHSEPCTLCNGTGRILGPDTTLTRIERWLQRSYAATREKRYVLKVHPDVAAYITALLRNNDPARFIESYELLSKAEDHSVAYSALTMPALILTGDGDEGSTSFMAMEMARAMPNARAEIIQGAKHIGIIERHQQFSDALISFVSERVI